MAARRFLRLPLQVAERLSAPVDQDLHESQPLIEDKGPATLPISGVFAGYLQGNGDLSGSDPPIMAQFQFAFDDAGNVTSGTLEKRDVGEKVSAIDLAGSSVTMDPNVPGRMIIHLNSRGAALLGSELAAYLDVSSKGFIMVGTPAKPSPQRGLGFLQLQREETVSDTSWGSGSLINSNHGR